MKLTGNAGKDCNPNQPMMLQLYELCLLVLLIPYSWIKNVRYITSLSLIANITSLVGFIIICKNCFITKDHFIVTNVNKKIIICSIIVYVVFVVDGLGDVNRLPVFTDWSSLPLYLGTALYAFQGATYVSSDRGYQL